jgi:hypothetical protein
VNFVLNPIFGQFLISWFSYLAAFLKKAMKHSIDFSQARFKHLNWKFRLGAFLDGKETLTREQVLSHKDCDLGKWFYSEGLKKYGHLKEMQEFEEAHIKEHQLIKEVSLLKEAGDLNAAEVKYAELLKVSDQVIAYLDEAEKIVNQKVDFAGAHR